MRFGDKVERWIGRLTRDTVEGNLEWTVKTPPSGLTDGSEVMYPLYLSADCGGRTVGIFSRKYLVWYEEDRTHWVDGTGLCLTEGQKVVWEYDKDTPGLVNLFKAASKQASGVESLIDDMIGNTV